MAGNVAPLHGGLALFCIIGKSILLMATYNEKMKRLEAERTRRPVP